MHNFIHSIKSILKVYGTGFVLVVDTDFRGLFVNFERRGRDFVGVLIDFLIIAFVVFMLSKQLSKTKLK